MAYCATIGFFDGVHLGHQFILRQLVATAQAEGLDSAVITFTEHPAKVLVGQSDPLLTSYKERMARLQESGVGQVFVFNFEAIHQMTAEEFMTVLKMQCGVSLLLMGYDQHFGSDNLRAFADYEMAAYRVGIHVRQMPPAPDYTQTTAGDAVSFLTADGLPMPAPSSTTIRRMIMSGDVSSANFLLGRPYALHGLVVEGRQIGRQIGFPTANLQLLPGTLIPAAGVYVCEVSFPKSRIPAPFERKRALLNVGTNPTVDGSETTLEVHIPAFEGNLYNRQMTVCPLRFVRGEQKFATLDELRQQIEKDLQSL